MIRAALTIVLASFVAAPAAGQTFRAGVHGVAVRHNEIDAALSATGLGAGGVLGARLGRIAIEARGYWAQVDPDDEDAATFRIIQGDVRVSFLLLRALAFEVGAGRRAIDPDFITQDVGLFRAGFLSEYALTRIASVWARGAYLIAPQFSGGGSSDLSVELGLGAALGLANGRLRVTGEYEFQRIDREVDRREVPIQVTVARVGVEIGF